MRKRILMLLMCLPMLAVAQTGNSMYNENYIVHYFKDGNKVKPSYVGIFHKENVAKMQQLAMDMALKWGIELPQNEAEMRSVSEGHALIKDVPDVSNSAQDKKRAEIEKQRKDALKQIDAMPSGYVDKAALKKEINKSFDQMLAELPGIYQEANKMQDEMKKEQQKQIDFGGQMVSVETLQNYTAYLEDFRKKLTPEQKADFKERVRQLAVGKKLWEDARGFRYGRAAVCSEKGWGFIDYSGNEVIPCKYARVFNFKNQDHTLGEFMAGNKDKDSRMWTTVILAVKGVGYNAGMVDANGREVIPCNFIPHSSGYDQIVFLQTPWGEYARVQERASKKHGIIDRNGNYTLPPTYDYTIMWDEERQCFSIYDWDAKQYVYFDYKGNVL